MLNVFVDEVLNVLIPLCELIGIAVVAISTLMAFGLYLKSLFLRTKADIKFQLASGLALSLEFKMAAEILKTVQVRDMTELAILGVVILLRALLSILIHFEMKQRSSDNEAAR